LYLGGNQIVDLSPLAGLTQLETVSFFSNQVVNISVLTDLTQLTTVDLSNNKISNLTPLKGLKQLKKADLGVNHIRELKALSGLKQLKDLNLAVNEIKDINALATLTCLENLDLSENKISDLAPLATLTALTELNLSKNDVSDISALETLVHLKELYLNDNQVSDIEPLLPLFKKKVPVSMQHSLRGKMIVFEGNPLDEAIMEVIKEGPLAIVQHFEQKDVKALERLRQFVTATEWIDQIRPDKAIKVLKPVFKESKNSEALAQLDTLSAELSSAKEKLKMGALMTEEYDEALENINETLLAMMR
jgi:Leucine-rich repeat (LRR) protein